MAHITLTDSTFQKDVLENPLPALVDCWAPWCPPCRLIEPILEELAAEYEGKIVLAKLNTDENLQTVQQLNVMSMPTIFIFKGGKAISTTVGARGKEAYKELIDQAINA